MIPELENHLWQSTLFACVVALLTLALRRNRAAVRHGLWLAASLKFLAPLALLVAVGTSVGWRKVPVAQFGSPVVRSEIAVVEQISEPFALGPPAPLVTPPPRAPNVSRSWLPAILFGVWLCGFAANGLAWWRRWRRVRAGLRAASPLHLSLPVRVMSSPARLEPGVFGVLRPILLLPEGITQRLTPAQFEAVLVHELCHVRRRDNLTAAIHMVVEALFWFHPLVWWIESRLVEERERACDEEVLRMATDPQDYAEGIVNVCKLYLDSPLVCVSGVTGGNLKQRVEAIMINRGASNLNFGRKLLLAGAGMLAVAGPLAVGFLNIPKLRAQSLAQPRTPAVDAAVQAAAVSPLVAQIAAPPAPRQPGPSAAAPAFETVSIRAVDPSSRIPSISPHMTDPQRLECKCLLSELIQWAYGVPRDFQISGGPAWLAVRDFQNPEYLARGEAFEVHATAARPSGEVEMKQMVQTLLSDRFRLKLHRETREIPIYALVVGPNGPSPRLAPTQYWDCDYVGCGFPQVGNGSVIASGGTMAGFAEHLTNNMDRPVIDKTNLAGHYAFRLTYPQTEPGWRAGSAILGPIQELGLKLEAQMETMEMLVIDSVDHPSQN